MSLSAAPHTHTHTHTHAHTHTHTHTHTLPLHCPHNAFNTLPNTYDEHLSLPRSHQEREVAGHQRGVVPRDEASSMKRGATHRPMSRRRRVASDSPCAHRWYCCGTDPSAGAGSEPEPMGDLGPFASARPTTALVDDALLGDAVTEDRRSCSSCGASCKARICLAVPVHGRGRRPVGAPEAAVAAAAAAAGRVSATGSAAAAAAARARRVVTPIPAGASAGVTGTGDDCCRGDAGRAGAGSAGAGVGAGMAAGAG